MYLIFFGLGMIFACLFNYFYLKIIFKRKIKSKNRLEDFQLIKDCVLYCKTLSIDLDENDFKIAKYSRDEYIRLMIFIDESIKALK